MGVNTFSKSFSSKVNVIVQLEFELACNNFAVHHINHITMGIPLKSYENTYIIW